MNRREKILKLIVEDFIKTANPVSSKALIEKYGLTYSSATIRSEMNALEQDGLLEKTHTSSGRVPSSQGYKYYIDNLRERSLDEEFKYRMQTILDSRIQSIDDVISKSCEILSHMTNLVSVVLGPGANEEHLVSVQIIPLSNSSVTCVYVTDRGYVESKTFVLDEKTRYEDVESCVKLLNDRLKGTAIANLANKMETLKPLLSDYIIEHDVIYKAMIETLLTFASDRLKTFGHESLLNNPDISSDAAKMKRLLEILENPEIFKSIKDDSDEEISIHIGGEKGEEDVSIISANLKLPNDLKSNIAIVGPKRMDYDKVVSSLEYLVEALDKYFFKEGTKEKKVDEGKEKKRKLA